MSRLLTLLALAVPLLTGQERRVRPAPRRTALVIGNSQYPWKPLKHAVNDAQSVAAKLKQIGFDDVTLLTDATRD